MEKHPDRMKPTFPICSFGVTIFQGAWPQRGQRLWRGTVDGSELPRLTNHRLDVCAKTPENNGINELPVPQQVRFAGFLNHQQQYETLKSWDVDVAPSKSLEEWCARNTVSKGFSGSLGGGFKHFLFLPQKLGKISNLTNIFEKGLKPPTSSIFINLTAVFSTWTHHACSFFVERICGVSGILEKGALFC